MRKISLFFMMILFPLITLEAQETIASRIDQIPVHDREVLTRFFKRLFSHGDFSYTLLGQKPMGSIDYNLDLLTFPQFYQEPHKHLFLMALDERGWRVWEKYQHLFPTRQYRFIRLKHDSFFGFILIHKEKAFEVIRHHLTTFQELVGKNTDASEIFEMLCEGEFGYYHSSTPSLLSYYKALGLLYGYGEDNVNTFVSRERLLQTLWSLPISLTTLPSDIVGCLEMGENQSPQITESIEVSSLITDLKMIIKQTELINTNKEHNPFLPIKKSRFLGDRNHPKTNETISYFDQLDGDIVKLHETENYLETILELLTAEVVK